MDYPNAMNAITRIESISKSFMDFDAKIRHVTSEKMNFTEYTCFDDVLREWAIPDYIKDQIKDKEKLLCYYNLVQVFFEGEFIGIANALRASKCRLSKKLKISHVLSEDEITSEVLQIRKAFLYVCQVLLTDIRRNYLKAQVEYLKSLPESELPYRLRIQ